MNSQLVRFLFPNRMFKGVGKGHVWFSNLVNTAQYPKSTSQSECAKNYIRAKNDRLYE